MKKAIILLNLESTPNNNDNNSFQSFKEYLNLFIVDSMKIFPLDINNDNNLKKLEELLNQLKKENYKIINILTISIFNN